MWLLFQLSNSLKQHTNSKLVLSCTIQSSSWQLEISGTHCYPTLSHAASVITKDCKSIRNGLKKLQEKVHFVQGRNISNHFHISYNFTFFSEQPNKTEIIRRPEQKHFFLFPWIRSGQIMLIKIRIPWRLVPKPLQFIILLSYSCKLPKNTHNWVFVARHCVWALVTSLLWKSLS